MLALALIAVLVVAGLSASFIQLSVSISRRQAYSVDRKRAFYLAEAGLAEAWGAVQVGQFGSVGSMEEPAKFGDGLFWVEATDLGDNLVELKSTGMCGAGRASLSAVIDRGGINSASLGLFSDDDLVVQAGTYADGFDGSAGDYASQAAAAAAGGGGGPGGALCVVAPPQRLVENEANLAAAAGADDGGEVDEGVGVGDVKSVADVSGFEYLAAHQGAQAIYGKHHGVGDFDDGLLPQARIGSNGSITILSELRQATTIVGNVTPGLGRSVTLIGSPVIEGSQEAARAPVVLPPVMMPGAAYDEAIVHFGVVPLAITAGSYAHESLTIATGSEAIVYGPATLELGFLDLQAAAALFFDTTEGEVTVYLEEGLYLRHTSALGFSDSDPRSVRFLSAAVQGAESGAKVVLRSVGDFQATVYAPQAKIAIGAQCHLLGSVVGKELVLPQGLRFHFDAAADEGNDNIVEPTLVAWRIVDLPEAIQGEFSRDPFRQLGVDRNALAGPAASRVTGAMRLRYIDVNGDSQGWFGQESAFDWSSAYGVIDVWRENPPGSGRVNRGVMDIDRRRRIREREENAVSSL